MRLLVIFLTISVCLSFFTLLLAEENHQTPSPINTHNESQKSVNINKYIETFEPAKMKCLKLLFNVPNCVVAFYWPDLMRVWWKTENAIPAQNILNYYGFQVSGFDRSSSNESEQAITLEIEEGLLSYWTRILEKHDEILHVEPAWVKIVSANTDFSFPDNVLNPKKSPPGASIKAEFNIEGIHNKILKFLRKKYRKNLLPEIKKGGFLKFGISGLKGEVAPGRASWENLALFIFVEKVNEKDVHIHLIIDGFFADMAGSNPPSQKRFKENISLEHQVQLQTYVNQLAYNLYRYIKG